MKLKSGLLAIIASATVGFAASAQADTFYLNYSNTVGDIGVNFAQVDVTESAGNLLFNVQSLSPAGWWIDKFYLNTSDTPNNVTLTGLPSGWVEDDGNVSMFGVFSDGAKGGGNDFVSPLTFTLDADDDMTLADLVPNKDGWLFAAHQKCGGKDTPACSGLTVDNEAVFDEEGKPITSHYIAGGPPAPVPVPAAAWLLGSALLGFVGYRRRG